MIYPFYDSAMFLAYLTTIPAMAMFLFNSETQFYEHYVRFYRDIESKASFARIEKNHQAIKQAIFGSAGHFFLLQGSIAILCLVMAPQIISLMHANFLQIGIFRYGLIGALFQVLTMFMLVLLSHFDSQKSALGIQAVFLVTNTVFTWFSMESGFSYYGYGYFLSSLVTFVIAVIIVVQYINRLPYHTFITTNTSAAVR